MNEQHPIVEAFERALKSICELHPDYAEHLDTIRQLYKLEAARISHFEPDQVDRVASLSVATMCNIIDEIRDPHPAQVASAILGDETAINNLIASLSNRSSIFALEEYQPFVLELLLRQHHELHPDYDSYAGTIQQLHYLEVGRLRPNPRFYTLTPEQLQRLANAGVAAICDAIDTIRSNHTVRLKKAIGGNIIEQKFIMKKLFQKLHFTQTYDTQDYDAIIKELLLRPLLE